MNLLLTNDDGYLAAGINTLFEELKPYHNVYILAPHTNRSSVSNCLSMWNGLDVKKINENILSCSGYPSDCVILGLRSKLFGFKIDAVLSGINNGPNLGTDIIYSGTCAASRQAVLLGCPSISFSLNVCEEDSSDKSLYLPLAKFASKNIEKLVTLARKEKNTFVNVNANVVPKYKGIEYASSLCERKYDDSFGLKTEKDIIKATLIPSNVETENISTSDYGICQNEKVSISLVDVNPVCRQVVDDLHLSI